MARILIIEDEELARFVMRDVLEAAGHQVVEAQDGDEGLVIQRSQPADLVVTDIFMPQKDGLETIAELRRASPDLSIIAVSGGGKTSNLDFLRFATGFGACRVLAKPFPAEDLLEAVRACLADRAGKRE